MALPRDRTVPPDTNGYYHCISRCVRRAWLCGYDKVKDIDYGYRRKWVEERILLLAEAFAVSIYAYAVMSNHCNTLDSHFSDLSEPNLRILLMCAALQAVTMK